MLHAWAIAAASRRITGHLITQWMPHSVGKGLANCAVAGLCAGRSPLFVILFAQLLTGQATVEAKIEATISCRGVYAVLRGYEMVCWKKCKVPDQSNAVRREIIKEEILVVRV